MTIEHTARNGKAWRISVDCTPYQAVLLRRMLSAIHAVGSREGLTLSYLANAEENDVFLTNAETAVLQALKDWAEATTNATGVLGFHLPNDTGKVEAKRTEANTDATVPTSTGAEDLPAEEPTEEREPYYWERDNF